MHDVKVAFFPKMQVEANKRGIPQVIWPDKGDRFLTQGSGSNRRYLG